MISGIFRVVKPLLCQKKRRLFSHPLSHQDNNIKHH